MTRLIAGGWAKSYLNHAFATSKSFWIGSGYSEASLSRTVGIESAPFGCTGVTCRSVDQPASGPAVDGAIGPDRSRADQRLHRTRDLVGREAEQARELALAREDGAARVTLD